MRRSPNPRLRHPGFTLIELLVVVTIIVVLIAMLTPALDKAIYAAELAKCGGGMKGIVLGELNYAFNNKRHYSDRPPARGANYDNYQTKQLSGVGTFAGSAVSAGTPTTFFDERLLLRPFMNVDAFVCPLAGSIKVNTAQPETTLFMPYCMFYSYQYRDSTANVSAGGQNQSTKSVTGYPTAGNSSMFRIGDKLSWTYNGGKTHKFSVIVADGGYFGAGFGTTMDVVAHPDSNGVLVNSQLQDSTDVTFSTSSGDPNTTRTQAGWGVYNPAVGYFDFNFGHDDGSVRRINHMWWNPSINLFGKEERTLGVPPNIAAPPNQNPGAFNIVPKED